MWRDYMHNALGDSEKAKAYDEQIRKNMEMFEEAVRLFSPFVPKGRPADEGGTGAASAKPAPEGAEALREMQKQMAEMQKQLALLAARSTVKD
jgi:polyhydroxyalkanoate synthesis regulator protein